MNRHDQRENAMITVYQYLIVQRDIHALINDVFKVDESEIDPYFIDVIKTSIENDTVKGTNIDGDSLEKVLTSKEKNSGEGLTDEPEEAQEEAKETPKKDK